LAPTREENLRPRPATAALSLPSAVVAGRRRRRRDGLLALRTRDEEHGKSGQSVNFERKRRREVRRHALVLARAQGCRCTPVVSWHPIVVAGRRGETVRLGHALDCPRLHELRRLAGEEPMPFDLLTGRLR
jgi:hypothetical protein